MKEVKDKISDYVWYTIFNALVMGNIVWMLLINGIAYMLDVPWIEVEHYVRLYRFSPSLKEITEQNPKRFGEGFHKNIFE